MLSLHRPEYLLVALYAGILAYFSSVFWSLEPESGALVRVVLLGFALLCVVGAFRVRVERRERGQRGRTVLAWAVQLPLGLFLLALLGWTHAYGYLTALFVSAWGTVAFALIEGLGLALCLWHYVRSPETRPRSVALASTLLFLGSMQFVFYALWMWSPPERDVCASVGQGEAVTLISPPHWPAELSQPYSLLFIPEKGGLVASFKMAGNGALPFWNDPNANRLLTYGVGQEGETRVMPLSGPNYPIHLIYDARSDQLLVSRVGTDAHALDLVDLSGFPEMKRVAERAISYPPHDLVTHPSADLFGVFTQHGTLNWVKAHDLEHIHEMGLGKQGGPATVTLNAWRRAGSGKVYVSMLLHPIVEVDLDARSARWSEVRLGGGYLAGDSEAGELYASDHLFNAIDVIDIESLKVVRSLEVDYSPRPLQVDPSRDLLMVGGWFDGQVRFYRMSTLEPLGSPVSFGAYLRDLAYDPKRGLLFGASKCGVSMTSVEPIAGSP